MKSRLLLLGATGKLGSACLEAASENYEVFAKSRRDFDASDSAGLRNIVEKLRPDLVINAAAFMGVDACEKNRDEAFRVNALCPKLLAELSEKKGFVLAHFSTDAVFDGAKGGFYDEEDAPHPLNAYGSTKSDGDAFVQAAARRHYLFRIPILFGETAKTGQFVERMLGRAARGEDSLRVSQDVYSSPSYSRDVAREALRLIQAGVPFGLYHLANDGRASLFDLMDEIARGLKLGVRVVGAPASEFAAGPKRGMDTPLRSRKIAPLRPWREACREYCSRLASKGG